MKTYRSKILAVGEDGTGKATLLHTMITGQYPEVWRSIVSSSGDIKDVVLSPKITMELALWTVPGLPDYRQARSICYGDTKVVLLCYSVNNVRSFEQISKLWQKEIRQFSKPGTPIILVASKLDARPESQNMTPEHDAHHSAATDDDSRHSDTRHSLRRPSDREQHDRISERQFVTSSEGRALSALVGAAAFIECSAKEGQNLEELLRTCAEVALQREKSRKRKSRDIDKCTLS